MRMEVYTDDVKQEVAEAGEKGGKQAWNNSYSGDNEELRRYLFNGLSAPV